MIGTAQLGAIVAGTLAAAGFVACDTTLLSRPSLHAAAPQPKEVRWYDAPHNLGQQAVLDRHRWLHEKIGLDAPPGS